MLLSSAVLALVRKRQPPTSLSIVGARCHISTTSSLQRSRMVLPYIPPVSYVSSRVLRILGCNPSIMTLQGTNTYVIGTGQRRVLIDTGDADFPEYIENLQETMIKYDFQIDDIIVTHWHSDHIGGVTNVLDMIPNKNECKVWKFKSPDPYNKHNYSFPLNDIKDQQVFNVEGASLKIHHAPGHTPDHVIVTLEEERALFSGDAILGEGTSVFQNLKEYLKSLQLILDLQPNIIFPGHGSVIDKPIDRVNNYIKHRLEREEQIYDLINSNPEKRLSEKDLVYLMYSNLNDNYKDITLYITRKHLCKLQEDGKVRTTSSKDVWTIA